MVKVLRISLYLDPEADPTLYQVFLALHPRRRSEKLRLLAEKGLSSGDASLILSPASQPGHAGGQTESSGSNGMASRDRQDNASSASVDASIDGDLAEWF